MDNIPSDKSDSNTNVTGNSEGFSIPVSTSTASPSPDSSNPAPFVSDFKSTSIAPSVPTTQNGELPNESKVPELNTETKTDTSVPTTGSDTNLDFDKSATTATPIEPMLESKPKLSAPIRAQNYSNKGSRVMTFILIIILILVVVGGVYGVYQWQHNSVAQLTSENTALNAQLSTVQSELKAAQKLAATPPATNTVIDFSAIGISVNLPSSLSSLTMATKVNPTKLTVNGASVTPTEVNLSTSTLSSLDSACSTANAALGVISKTSGTYPTSPTSTNSSGTLVEQFSGYYIAYSAPLACSKVASTNTTQTTLVKDLETALVKANISVL
jgi:hypothetical protein